MKINIKIDGRSGSVNRKDYVRNTLRRLQEFGYPDLKENEVNDAVSSALAGENKGDVISMFVSGEVPVETAKE